MIAIASALVRISAAWLRKGLNVTIVVDAIGSFNLWGRPVRRLREAGCRIESYQRLRWYSLARFNNRTHRELLVIDGRRFAPLLEEVPVLARKILVGMARRLREADTARVWQG